MNSLFEKYRPRTLGELIAQPKAVETAKRLIKRGLGGRAVWISGCSGSGKTSLAKILAREVADDCMIQEFNSSDITADRLRSIASECHSYGFGRGGRCYLVDESHGLRRDNVRQLLTMLEQIPNHVLWVFCTTSDGQTALLEDYPDSGPLLSRCALIQLSRQGLARPFAEHVQRIAQAEGLDGLPIERYVKLLRDCRNNMRSALQAVECGEMLP